MLESLKIFALFLIIPFIYSCQTPAVAQDLSLKKEIAYAQVAKVMRQADLNQDMVQGPPQS